jgi:hypothetical protein
MAPKAGFVLDGGNVITTAPVTGIVLVSSVEELRRDASVLAKYAAHYARQGRVAAARKIAVAAASTARLVALAVARLRQRQRGSTRGHRPAGHGRAKLGGRPAAGTSRDGPLPRCSPALAGFLRWPLLVEGVR